MYLFTSNLLPAMTCTSQYTLKKIMQEVSDKNHKACCPMMALLQHTELKRFHEVYISTAYNSSPACLLLCHYCYFT